MHSLSTSFVLGYHGCDATTGEKLLNNEPFKQSENDYDWLGPGIYFWEANPRRALDWAHDLGKRKARRGSGTFKPFVVGAVINLGFCLDLITSNGIQAVEQAHKGLVATALSTHFTLPVNEGGDDLLLRRLDCAVIQYLHAARKKQNEPEFDTVRGVFTEAKPLYENSGFRRKTHIQICVISPNMIKGVFRVPPQHFE
ncbi:hypothetical protein AciPR4_3465 [Terriglobus saanensis SP1PR4]|uniref:DUF3990 domain-containing protein n=1 Tax=Terriglobus saanensis (strain ATCC BAA-1853 / DSM 23119 / SP1PR4) TaxID=401053 RepID=E8UXY5_TERSS|nr:hypothetical protein AciPR4_3465 [Terriglobus saanensis SP1PR4]